MSLLFGIIVGFSLGLTGGGGSIFAVPLLVYGLAVPVHQAVVVSLAAVGAMALAGAVTHLRSGAANWQIGTIFGLAGIVGAPVGAWMGTQLPADWLLRGFALLMLLVAVRLWRQTQVCPAQARVVRVLDLQLPETGFSCRGNQDDVRAFGSHYSWGLLPAGMITGLLAGLFGVGGGFLIVPALVLVVSMPIRSAAATSLLVISIICVAGVISHLLTGQTLNWELLTGFVGGGLLGMGLGISLGKRLAGPVLQRLFATMMVCVALFMLLHGYFAPTGSF